MAGSDDWQPLNDLEPLSDEYRSTHRQLRDGDARLDARRARQGLSSERLDELIERQELRPFDQFSEQLIGLTRTVEALGGRVEIRAVFDDETITLLREPTDPDEPF